MKTFKQAYERFKKQGGRTHYEVENNITIEKRRVLDFSDNLKAVLSYASNGEIGITLFFNGSTKNPYWFFWYPSEEQFLLFDVLKDMYERIDNYNYKIGDNDS